MKKRYFYYLAPLVGMATFCLIMLIGILVTAILTKEFIFAFVIPICFLLVWAVPMFIDFSDTFSMDEKGIVIYHLGRERFVFPWEEMESAFVSFVPRAGSSYQFITKKGVDLGFEYRKTTKKLLYTYAPKNILEMFEESKRLQNCKQLENL